MKQKLFTLKRATQSSLNLEIGDVEQDCRQYIYTLLAVALTRSERIVDNKSGGGIVARLHINGMLSKNRAPYSHPRRPCSDVNGTPVRLVLSSLSQRRRSRQR
jgi:hypothetical protein